MINPSLRLRDALREPVEPIEQLGVVRDASRRVISPHLARLGNLSTVPLLPPSSQSSVSNVISSPVHSLNPASGLMVSGVSAIDVTAAPDPDEASSRLTRKL